MLFIADCVICGFGRLGTWLGIDRWDVEPDDHARQGPQRRRAARGRAHRLERVGAPFFSGEPGAAVFRHGVTYAGHPACCAAANAALDIYERERLIPRGRELEGRLEQALRPLADHPLVAEVRAGLGLMAGVDLTPEALAADPAAVTRWQLACRDAGLLVRPLGRGIAVSPPLTITAEQIDAIGTGIGEALTALERELARA